MKPDEAAHEVREHNVFIPLHRLAELFSVIDGELWAPDNETGLRERLAGYMQRNAIVARAEPHPGYRSAPSEIG